MHIKYIYVIVGFAGSLLGMYLYRNVLNPVLKEVKYEQHATCDSLWDAVMNGSYERVEQLIAQGASASEYHNGVSPLHIAAERGDLQIAELLLMHGADVNAPNRVNNISAFDIALENRQGDMVELFMQYGAEVIECQMPDENESGMS